MHFFLLLQTLCTACSTGVAGLSLAGGRGVRRGLRRVGGGRLGGGGVLGARACLALGGLLEAVTDGE